ncbi:glutaredoxin 3 [Afifella sp. IM 167]|uniref:glutaredoxin 3 n=1 Tax=Afifella sp. IM 167 TaxID=2033586 RepID=UPI001CCA423C|nr:glutaredoxin 3 [Afifella sp. IM 167]MBZ8133018.1 glutaredoxin 3 [Afifella sp. IM 167]
MPKVTIYTRQFCGFCSAAIGLLQSKDADLEEIDATFEPEKRQEMMTRSRRQTFPQIFIGDTHVGGCDDLFALERNGELDRLLAAS